MTYSFGFYSPKMGGAGVRRLVLPQAVLSPKLKSEAQSGGGSAGRKSQGQKGKGKSQGVANVQVKRKAEVEDTEAP